MQATVAEDYSVFLFGHRAPMGKKELIEESFQKGSLWRDVEMLSEAYSDGQGAIYYRGIDTATDTRVFACEFLLLNDQGRIAQNHTMVFPPPSGAGFGNTENAQLGGVGTDDVFTTAMRLPASLAVWGILRMPCLVASRMGGFIRRPDQE